MNEKCVYGRKDTNLWINKPLIPVLIHHTVLAGRELAFLFLFMMHNHS